jgi:hypothetical protein
MQIEEIAGQSGKADNMRFGDHDMTGVIVVADSQIFEPVFCRLQPSRRFAVAQDSLRNFVMTIPRYNLGSESPPST